MTIRNGSLQDRLVHGVVVAVLSVLCGYALLEAAVRVFDLPDRSLIFDMEYQIEQANGDLAAHFSWPASVYGWDQPEIVTGGGAAAGEAPRTVLVVGDSITRGYGLNSPGDAFPASLLASAPESTQGFRVVNAAVQGFGTGQMMLKLEKVVSVYRPEVVVFAYIPHDLWRAGRDINNGVTKPVLFDFVNHAWRMNPAPDLVGYYREYLYAKSHFYLSIWVLEHVAANARYYFSMVAHDYYSNLFVSIRRRLVELARVHRMQVLVVRLASAWPGRAVPALDRIAAAEFAKPAEGYRFLDTEACVRSAAAKAGVDFAEQFRWHPNAEGHAMYASCIGPTVLDLLQHPSPHGE